MAPRSSRTVRIGSSRAGTQTRQRERFPLGHRSRADPRVAAWREVRARHDGAERARARHASRRTSRGFIAALPEGRYRDRYRRSLDALGGGPARRSGSPHDHAPRDRRGDLRMDDRGRGRVDVQPAPLAVAESLSGARRDRRESDGRDRAVARTERPSPAISPRAIVQLILDVAPGSAGARRAAKHGRRSSLTKIRSTRDGLDRDRARDASTRAAAGSRPRHTRACTCARVARARGRMARGSRLLPLAVEAFRDFAAAGLFGRAWSESSVGKTWRVGIARATAAADRLAAETGDRSGPTTSPRSRRGVIRTICATRSRRKSIARRATSAPCRSSCNTRVSKRRNGTRAAPCRRASRPRLRKRARPMRRSPRSPRPSRPKRRRAYASCGSRRTSPRRQHLPAGFSRLDPGDEGLERYPKCVSR